MYSMVLMMAMASGPDTAAFGGGRGNSCCGAQAVSTSCQGGSGCHGSRRGGGMLGHRNSCNGGGCTGGGRDGLFHRNRGGCTGATAAACCQPAQTCCAPAASCCAPGGVVVVPGTGAPPATMPAPTPMGDKKGS